jgi:hypothetical protein
LGRWVSEIPTKVSPKKILEAGPPAGRSASNLAGYTVFTSASDLALVCFCATRGNNHYNADE